MRNLFKSGRIQKIMSSAFWMLIFYSVSAQNSGFVKGDENYTLTLAFHKVDTVLVVVPHIYEISDQEKRTIENYVFWDQYQKKPIYVYKKETELTSGDNSKHLQFYGPFCDFKIAEIQNIPIKQIPGGFRFNDEAFTHAADAFFYINDEANRLYTCQNSRQVFSQSINFAAGYFQLYIFNGDDLYLSGKCSSKTGQSELNHIREMRKAYFKPVKTKYFDFELAKSLPSDSISQVILAEADVFLETLCATLHTDTSGLERMTTYVYKNMDDLQQFLSMSPRMTIYGKSIGSINHLSSFDMSVFKHETAHTIIGRKIGIQSNSFFSEGFAVYTGYFFENNSYTKDLEATRTHLDLLKKETIIGEDHRFYSLPPLYAISGTFTKFIIGKIGINAFKHIYAHENIEAAFQGKGFSLENLIAEFKNSLTKINSGD